MRSIHRLRGFSGVFLLGLAVTARGEIDQAWFQSHYTRQEYQIPMRDGARLHTAVYAPKDASRKHPILLTRTPYGTGPYGPDAWPEPNGPMRRYASEGFIFAQQDVRGRYASDGDFVNVRPVDGPVNDSTDAYDTIDWLVRRVPENNGRVGMIGSSYPGFYTAVGIIGSHPALKCAIPQAPIADWFLGDDFHQHGALNLAEAFGFFATFGQSLRNPVQERPKPFLYGTPDGYQFFLELGRLADAFEGKIPFWNDLMAHGTYDAFWQARSLPPRLKNIHAAVLVVGGWFDAEDLAGPLAVYRAVGKNNPGIKNVLVMGPWHHGAWEKSPGDRLGMVSFGGPTSEYYRERIERPFLLHYLCGDTNPELPQASVFETGSNRWRQFDAWPPSRAKTTSVYLRDHGRLDFDPPASTDAPYDEYVSDPAKPVPYFPEIARRMVKEYMVADQRFAATRPDVLVYQTPALEQAVTVAGPIEADLQISTTGTDADWVVKIIDVYPPDFPNPSPNPSRVEMGGYQQLVRGELMRGKFRDSYERPRAFDPGAVTRVRFEMSDVFHTFSPGHRIMVQVQSSWFPLLDRNPQTFVDIYTARPEDFTKATQRVYHTPANASRLVVRMLGN